MSDPAQLRRRLLLAAAFAILLALAFPFRAGDFRFDVGFVAGWAALVPFALLLRGMGPRQAFAWGAAAGTAAYSAIVYWIFVVVYVHGHAPAPIAVGAVLVLGLYVGVHIGATGATVAALEPWAGGAAPLVLPAAWVVFEHLRTLDVWTSFPWAFLGYSQHLDGPILELAAIGGVWGISFLLAAFAAIASRGRFRAAVLVVALAHAVGFLLRLSVPAPDPTDAVEVGLVQASIPQEEKWDPTLAQRAFEAHLETSRLAAAAGDVQLIVWPEASVPVLLQAETGYRRAVVDLARETGAVLVIGGMAIEPDPERPPNGLLYFNSIFLVNGEGEFVDRYDKSRLVPFGEYVPMRWLFSFLSGIATGIASGDITRGPGPRPLRGDTPGFDHALAPFICYEVIYPSLVRQAVLGGGQILLNLTNDAWYGKTSAPHQFLAIAAMRSAETGRPMLRAANTGVSAIIDAGGWVLEQTPIFERRALNGRLPPLRPGTTPYTRFGDWVVWASWGILIAIGGRRVVGRGRDHSQGDTRSALRAGGADRGAAEAPLTSPGSGSASTS